MAITFLDDERSSGLEPIDAIWSAKDSAADVLARLIEAMVSAGYSESSKRVDMSLLVNLQRAIAAAVSGRQSDPGAWTHGAFDEWIADGWAVTSDGLCIREHEDVAPDSFPLHMDEAVRGGSNWEILNWRAPDPPAGVDPRFWEFVLSRSRRRHHRRRHPDPEPFYTSETSPRKRPAD